MDYPFVIHSSLSLDSLREAKASASSLRKARRRVPKKNHQFPQHLLDSKYCFKFVVFAPLLSSGLKHERGLG